MATLFNSQAWSRNELFQGHEEGRSGRPNVASEDDEDRPEVSDSNSKSTPAQENNPGRMDSSLMPTLIHDSQTGNICPLDVSY